MSAMHGGKDIIYIEKGGADSENEAEMKICGWSEAEKDRGRGFEVICQVKEKLRKKGKKRNKWHIVGWFRLIKRLKMGWHGKRDIQDIRQK